MARRTIPQRDLRNNIAAILREAQSGTVFTVTVRGEPVAQLGPPDSPSGPRVDVDRATIRRILALPIDSDDLAADLDAAEATLDDPWEDA
jgi:prevent-host-death family protein